MKLQERLRERIVPGMQRLPDGVLLTEAADAIDAHEARVKTLEDRLEISHAYDIAGNKVPFPEGGPDGIECRNETIRLLETRIKVLEEALLAIIERWDTPNWKESEHTGAVINRARAALEGK